MSVFVFSSTSSFCTNSGDALQARPFLPWAYDTCCYQQSPLSRLSLSHQGGLFSHSYSIPPCLGRDHPTAPPTQVKKTLSGVSIPMAWAQAGLPPPFPREDTGQGWGAG